MVDKPALIVAGRSLLSRALDAVTPALTVVVGPSRQLPSAILQTREDPPRGGPAAAVVAGLAALSATRALGPADLVAVLAADLPGVDAAALAVLTRAVLELPADGSAGAGAVLVDPSGRDQFLFGVWQAAALQIAARSRGSWHGARLGDLLAPLVGVRVPADSRTTADIDTTADVRQWGATWSEGPAGPADFG